jgi:hypothetical protein
MSNLTPDELARLRLKAKHGMLTPEEQQAYDDYATEQLSAVSSPPSGAVPPKKGFKWESEKVAEWRLKARHDGLDENERLLYQDYQQTLALAEADANASDAKFTGESSERQLKKSAILRGVMSLALVVLIGMYVMTGCKLSESPFLVQYTMYEINYRLTGELPDTNEVWSNYLDMTKSQAGVPLVAITGAWDLGSFLQNTHSSVARLELVGGVPDECFFDEVVSGLRGTSDMTEVHRHIFSDEALWNFQVYLAQKEDPSYDPGPYVPYDWNGGVKPTIEDLGNGSMDFWASLEHTIRYKKNLPINAEIETELKECADSSREWDGKMEQLLHILT